jgi:hypothetical protein
MSTYLGEYEVDIKTTPFANYGPAEWALHFIERYGGNDGAHHKQWVLDQVARILTGTRVIVTEARWQGGVREWRFHTYRPASDRYWKWVEEMKSGEDGPDTYTWDEGITP